MTTTNTSQLGVDISINDYHALPHISNSDLTHINKSIDHWLKKMKWNEVTQWI